MKRTLNLSIPAPCTEKWENFEPRPEGGFCQSCSKTVVDLTRLSDDQIIDFFKNKPAHVCGRLRTNQLRGYALLDPVKINPGFTLLKAGLLSLPLLLTGKFAAAQPPIAQQQTEVARNADTRVGKVVLHRDQFTVSGIVKDRNDESVMPGVNILLKGTEVGISADADGRFTFPRKLEAGDVLVVSFIGYETQEYTVPSDYKGDEVLLLMPMEMMLGAVVVGGVYVEETSVFHKLWSKIKALF